MERNMSLEKVKMPELDPQVRATNFEEVALGYTPEMAQEESNRCLECKNKPCVSGCPVQVNIPEFIHEIKEGNFMAAYQKIVETNGLPAVCGRVCPQESQCEKYCVRGKKGEPVGIGRLERFAADFAMSQGALGAKKTAPKKGKKVAVIGSGPSGLTCASDLAKKGYDVTVFEAFHTAGGVLKYGIPQFRLPKEIVDLEINVLKEMGVKIDLDMVIGKILTLDELKEMGYEAIFIGSGAGLPSFMNIPGENFNDVYSANEFLTRVNLMHAYQYPSYDTPIKPYQSVAVIGGGNVAMDAARCAKRLGAGHVYIVYRRSEAEMPARLEEVHHAKEEGIDFRLLEAPVEILGDEHGNVTGMKDVRMELGEPDASGRRRPVVIEGSEYVLPVDAVIVAIGQSPNPMIKNATPALKTQPWGGIIVNEKTGETSIPGVYAGGDAVTGAATVILAMGAGKTAANSIDEYLSK
ncbi:NADPH-dependent glutamate synthase [Christensenella tenuis]|uniref:NADPH-dependent glutamate synthase n=1 Tax=Christensenella tenuis TaxID=2763033 RepID=A0ABR7EIX9_9FIRM|nr:NADPH-dependent glutamate synthase [Christensenella tenuis]MBC5649341.1 NADPH-dependent glutamate synthase [Christensenella tenuis]